MTVPSAAEIAFGARRPLAERYAALLGTDGIAHGLIGPREADRLWDRHLLNSAAMSELVPRGARLVDVGSGAGLPGLPVAIARPDVSVMLVEPMARRVAFLTSVVAELALDGQVSVVRGRAEEPALRRSVGDAEWVCARAVAPLDRLVAWCLPLLRRGGSLLAMKGSSAAEEIETHRARVLELGGSAPELVTCGSSFLNDPVRVVVVRRR